MVAERDGVDVAVQVVRRPAPVKWIEFESKFSMKLSSCWPIRSVTICLNMPGTESQDGRWTSTSKHLLAASVTYLLAARTAARLTLHSLG